MTKIMIVTCIGCGDKVLSCVFPAEHQMACLNKLSTQRDILSYGQWLWAQNVVVSSEENISILPIAAKHSQQADYRLGLAANLWQQIKQLQ